MGKLDQFLEWVHDGRDSEYDKMLKVFRTTRNFLKYVIKYGEEDNFDMSYIPESEFKKDSELFDYLSENGFLEDVGYYDLEDHLKNYYLKWLLNTNETEALRLICELLTDVEPRSDGYWLRLRDREELADFFRSSSRRSDYDIQEIAKQVLTDGLEYGWYSDTTDDVYRDVIEVLNEQNIQNLANYIVKNMGNQDLPLKYYKDELFHQFSEEQETEGVFKIDSENVMRLIGDEDAMKELFKKDLDELKSELHSIHNQAYNVSYEDMIYDQVMDGLEEYFSSPIDDVATKVGEKTKYISYIKIRDFYSNVLAFIDDNLGGSWNESVLEYWGSYTGMMGHLFSEDVYEPIDFRVDDYPDYRKVDKQINELFGEQI